MIKQKFVKYGHTFECILSGEIHSIYKRTTKAGNDCGYEVIRPVVIGGDLVYPSSSFWGLYGWTALNYEHALEIFSRKETEFLNKNNNVCSENHEDT